MTEDQKKVLEKLIANDLHPERGEIQLAKDVFGDVYFERLTSNYLERWHNNGQLWMQGLVKDGELNGLCEWRHENGTLVVRGSYKEGYREGLWEEWYRNGQLFSRCTYTNGWKNGLEQLWSNNGKLSERCVYKDGLREGLYESWYSDGQLAVRGNYKDDLKEGVWEKWNIKGEIYERQIYRDNKIVQSLLSDDKNMSVGEVDPLQLTDTDNSKKNNDIDSVVHYDFACKGEQPVNGKVPIDLYLLGFGGFYPGSDLLYYDGLFDGLNDNLKEQIGDWSVEVSDDDVRALCDSVDEEAYKQDMSEELMGYYIDCINETYPVLVEAIESEPVRLEQENGFSSCEIHQRVLVDLAKLKELHAACIADPNFFKALEQGDYELPFHLESIDGRFLSDSDKPWDDLEILGPLEINNLLYINANLNNSFDRWSYNNITELSIDRAWESDVQLQSYVDTDLMEQIASKYKNEKKKSISLPLIDKKQGKGRKV